MNHITIMGRLGADPETRGTPSGQTVTSLRVAVNESWTAKDGQRQERTEWFGVTVWGRLGELCGEHLTQGRQVVVEGRMQSREYTDKEGVTRRAWEVRADRVHFVGDGRRRADEGVADRPSAPRPPSGGGWGDTGGGIDDDPIPF